ncbi:MAG: hypothetical protein LV480_07870 [Methylacidiphilales bacterium]|nr:hypothetical protein [Candidatus Methylacidiphilales bacterium]
MLTQEWNIQSRALQCAVSGRPFEKGERVFSALYWRDGHYSRVDLCAEAWNARNENIEPLSAWQTDFVPPAPPVPEPLRKDDAESLLRRLMTENAPGTRNARYILALMLERKKVVRQIERQRQEGSSTLVYEHLPSGEVWLIEDPGLKLGELSAVQDEVAHLLAPAEGTPAEGGTSAVQPTSSEAV